MANVIGSDVARTLTLPRARSLTVIQTEPEAVERALEDAWGQKIAICVLCTANFLPRGAPVVVSMLRRRGIMLTGGFFGRTGVYFRVQISWKLQEDHLALTRAFPGTLTPSGFTASPARVKFPRAARMN